MRTFIITGKGYVVTLMADFFFTEGEEYTFYTLQEGFICSFPNHVDIKEV